MSVKCYKNVVVFETKDFHYAISYDKFGNVYSLHWGDKCPIEDYYDEEVENRDWCPDINYIRSEYSPYGKPMFRQCAMKVNFPDGCREVNAVFVDCKVEGDSAVITLKDEYYPLTYSLNYKVYYDYDIIERSVTITNTGSEELSFEELMSSEFSLPDTKPYHIMNTNGDWGCEFTPVNSVLEGGTLSFESRMGRSGHITSPYFIAYRNANEKQGKVYFANFKWSGNFKITLERDKFFVTRAYVGFNTFDFEFVLKGGESFTTPETICGVAEGFGNMSRNLNAFGYNEVLPKNFAKKELPILYNSWEATEFDVNVKAQSALAKKAAAAGCELFVMDDGWFGERNDDHAGLGDWFVNKEKFPNGLGELIENVNALGMDFGLWVEPEMVNPNSDLYRAHPDWAYHYEHRKSNEIRNQLVLNMTKPEVQAYIFKCIDDLLTENNIKYIKWDMNRVFSETGGENLEHPKELWYLHTKAVYDIVDRLKEKHPEVQFESCSSGGGRCDWGALAHYDQVWTSDNTDAIDRIILQKNYSLTRPIKTMRAWVTDVNWYNRDTPLDFRFNIAMRGVLSLGGNLDKYSDSDIEECKKFTDVYKGVRSIVQFGNRYRLLDYDEDEISADLYVDENADRAVLFIAAVNTRCMKRNQNLYFDGLDDNKLYSFTLCGKEYKKTGAYLKNVGISVDIKKQYFNEVVLVSSQ